MVVAGTQHPLWDLLLKTSQHITLYLARKAAAGPHFGQRKVVDPTTLNLRF
ncbi:Uncharacterised protein [Vibrio cholerae]|nr:Uncharacterised protein [Vibrio cholerae]